MRKRSSLLPVVFLLMLLLWPHNAAAAPSVKGIVVFPALQDITLDIDKPSVSFPVKITNTSKDSLNLELSMLDFGALNESGGLAFIGRSAQETTSYGLREWMSLEKTTLTLKPGESQSVQATVDNKLSLSPGGHYGAIVVTSQQEADKDNQSVAVLPSASVLVLLKKVGGETLKLNLLSAKPAHSIVSLPKGVSLRFRNEGNTHVVPRGTVKIQDPFNHVIGRGIINEDSSFVLPEAYRVLDAGFTSAPKGWLPGRYSVTTTWRYDGTTKTTTSVTHVWYIGLIPIISISIIVFLICMIFVRKRFSRRKPSRA